MAVRNFRGRDRGARAKRSSDRKINEEIRRVESDLDGMESQLNSTSLVISDRNGASSNLLPISKQKIGEILVEQGALRPSDVEKVLEAQQKKNGRMLFGEVAIYLGLVGSRSLARALSLQFGYPCALQAKSDISSELVGIIRPFSREAENLRSIRSRLLLTSFDLQKQSLAIVSPGAGEGRSYLAANLAVVFAQAGKRTLLIDADMRRPRQHAIFKLPTDTGLSLALSGRSDECMPYQMSVLPSLFIVPAGPTPPNPQELVTQPEFGFLLQEAKEHFHVVLIDTPPACGYSDAELIAARAGLAIIVSQKDETRAKALKSLSDRLAECETDVLGCVLNCQD